MSILNTPWRVEITRAGSRLSGRRYRRGTPIWGLWIRGSVGGETLPGFLLSCCGDDPKTTDQYALAQHVVELHNASLQEPTL